MVQLCKLLTYYLLLLLRLHSAHETAFSVINRMMNDRDYYDHHYYQIILGMQKRDQKTSQKKKQGKKKKTLQNKKSRQKTKPI